MYSTKLQPAQDLRLALRYNRSLMIQNQNPPPVAFDLAADGAACCRLTGGPITLEALDAALGRPIRVEIDDPVWSRIEASCAAVQKKVSGRFSGYPKKGKHWLGYQRGLVCPQHQGCAERRYSSDLRFDWW